MSILTTARERKKKKEEGPRVTDAPKQVKRNVATFHLNDGKGEKKKKKRDP